MKIKTHTFKNGKYRIDQSAPLDGLCDMSEHSDMTMYIPSGNNPKDLATVLHEACHAENVSSKYLDGDTDITINIAKFLWRLGWRKTKTKKE